MPVPRSTCHPAASQLARFARGDLGRSESREVVRHLLAGCARCARSLRRSWPGPRPEAWLRGGLHPAAYRGVWPALLEGSAALVERARRERRQAPRLVDEVLGWPAGERAARVIADDRVHTLAVVELLLEGCRSRRRAPEEAAEVAATALAAAGRLDERSYGPTVRAEACARASGALAEARLRRGDLDGAGRALDAARAAAGRCAGARHLQAELLLLAAALRSEHGDLRRAGELLDRGARLARRTGDRHLEGCCLLARGALLGRAGDAEGAVELLRRGLGQVDDGRDPELVLEAHLDLVGSLIDGGRRGEAPLCLERARALGRRSAHYRAAAPLRWLEGRLAAALGRERAAVEALAEAVGELRADGRGPDAVRASLDLARLGAGSGRGGELRASVGKLLGPSSGPTLPVEALLSLYLLRCAAESGRARPGLVAQLALLLESAGRRRGRLGRYG